MDIGSPGIFPVIVGGMAKMINQIESLSDDVLPGRQNRHRSDRI
jgi:hypothetical protein